MEARERDRAEGETVASRPASKGDQPSGLTLERLTARPSLSGTAPTRPLWSSDGQWLAFLWDDVGREEREIWVVEREGSVPRPLTGARVGQGSVGGVTDLAWIPAAHVLVYVRGQEVWEIEVPDGMPRHLATAEPPAWPSGEISEIGVSPDGATVSFLANGDLWLLTRKTAALRQATKVGEPPLGAVPLGTYYRPDAAIGPATWGGPPSYAWSPDGRFIAVHYVDRRHVSTMSFPYYLGEAPIMNVLRRSRPGEENEVRTVGFFRLADGSLRLLDLPETTEMRVVTFSWSPAGTLLIDRESDDAVDRRLCLADPATATVREIWHDHRESRIYNDIAAAWYADGRSILLSADLDDRYRLYLFTPHDVAGGVSPATATGCVSPDVRLCAGELRPLTRGPFDVTGPGIPVPGTGDVLYVSSEPSPYERHVWRTEATGARRTRLTTRPGTHAPFLSPDGLTLALLSSDDITPTELYLTEAQTATEPRRITHSPSAAFEAFRRWAARYVSFPHRSDRWVVHARIIEPPHLDPSKKYPVVFGNMYSNTVRNRWEPRFAALQQYLAVERGYIVVQVDVRGSTGYGRDFREAFLMDWGGGDLEDIESAVEYVKTLPYVDDDRLGIWGTSYGGTLTIYSLLRKPGLFRAGVAAAPAVDPYYFGSDDVAICRRPQTHPETFRRGALQYAANLHDHLLIIHGMMDDVVPFQTSVALAEELMRLGKDFEVAFAPAATHAWSSRPDYALFLMRRLVGHFDRYLA